ncbi:hypothetical protein SKAU_G00034030 [Synaphobranchus kaupii]|uniref:Uncharacterized protein n=1 Tax=Synaphobranchus kaupii TaxID=118154 RepID=A0A9Q1GEE5_SYNKA|nr:hypothetical protein SKAU_G00034030 [Synaphobranchus kaupii]
MGTQDGCQVLAGHQHRSLTHCSGKVSKCPVTPCSHALKCASCWSASRPWRPVTLFHWRRTTGALSWQRSDVGSLSVDNGCRPQGGESCELCPFHRAGAHNCPSTPGFHGDIDVRHKQWKITLHIEPFSSKTTRHQSCFYAKACRWKQNRRKKLAGDRVVSAVLVEGQLPP